MSMQKFARAVVLAFGLGIVAIALGLFSTHPAGAAGSAPVTVTNTPLPVQGTVGAAQSGAWNVGISGTPSVNVSSLPAVQFNGAQPVAFSNAEANPVFTRDADNPGRHSYVGRFTCRIPSGQAFCDAALLPAPPAGKVLIIETIAVEAAVPSGNRPTIQLLAMFLPMEFAFTYLNGNDQFVGLHAARMYISSGAGVSFEFQNTSGASSGSASGTVFGYVLE